LAVGIEAPSKQVGAERRCKNTVGAAVTQCNTQAHQADFGKTPVSTTSKSLSRAIGTLDAPLFHQFYRQSELVVVQAIELR
jgi:hypothetical protein